MNYFVLAQYDGYSLSKAVEVTVVMVLLLIPAVFAILLLRLLVVGAPEYVGEGHDTIGGGVPLAACLPVPV